MKPQIQKLQENTELKDRFFQAKKSLKKVLSKVNFDMRKNIELEASYQIRTVVKHGFKFVPEHYVLPSIIVLEELVKQAGSLKR